VGLLFGKIFIGLAVVFTLAMICRLRMHSKLVYAIVMVLAVFVISPGFMIRPQIFSFLFFAIYTYILYLYLLTGKNLLYSLPILMLVWVNLHGGFLMGWVLVFAVTAWKTLTRLITGKRDKQLRPFFICSFSIILASLANPYNYKLLVFLYQTLSIERNISEWQSVNIGDLSYIRFKLMAILFIGSLIFYFKKSRGWEVIAITMLLFAAIRHERHTPFFAIMAAPYLVSHLSSFVQAVKDKYKNILIGKKARDILALALGLLIVYQIANCRYIASGGRIIVATDKYPVNAVRFLLINKIKGNIILPFTWGEYAIWKLHPSCKVSIDGRFRTVYPETVISDHFFNTNNQKAWQVLINKYEGDIILTRQPFILYHLIQQKKKWVYVYSDKTAVIFLKNCEKQKETLAFFRSGLLKYPKTTPSIYFP
jgi:hypothetical protein